MILRGRRQLPEARTLPWPLRDVGTARHSIEHDGAGRLVMSIEHAELPGITPEDLSWWFANIAGEVTIGGISMTRYLAWHPRDHIHWALARPGPNGLAEVGARFRIVEAFGRDARFQVDIIEDVTRLDSTGITLEKRVLGQVISRLSHDFTAGTGGARYSSCLTVGIETSMVRHAANAAIRRFIFPELMGRAWIRHNIEEVGLLEHLIPMVRKEL